MGARQQPKKNREPRPLKIDFEPFAVANDESVDPRGCPGRSFRKVRVTPREVENGAT
jgi:hypothetical protein